MNPSALLNVKDSRWLQLEVCREYQRNKCTRSDTECKFAHPAANVEIQNGRVVACYDSIKGRCNREKPPCKYFHPPKHLKDQLVVNGKNHLALKNALLHQVTPFQTVQLPLQTQPNPYLAQAANLPALAAAYGAYQHHQLPGFANAMAAAAAAASSPQNGNAAAATLLHLNSASEHSLASLYSGHAAAAQHLHPSLVRTVGALATPSVSPPANASSPIISVPITGSGASLPASGSVESQQSSAASTVVGQTVSSPSGVSAESNGSSASSTSGIPLNYASYMQSNIAANAAALTAAAAAGRKRARDPNDDLAMLASVQQAAAIAAATGGVYGAPLTKRTALDKSSTMYLPFANPYSVAGATAATVGPATTSVPGLPTAAVPQSIVPLPLNYYFPLVGQSSTLPRY